MKRLLGYQFLRQRFGTLSLRAHLFALVGVSVLPFLVFAFLVLNLFARREKASLATGLRETTRALSSALDREFEATKTAPRVVAATLEELDSGDLGPDPPQAAARLTEPSHLADPRAPRPVRPSSFESAQSLRVSPLPETDFEQERFRAAVSGAAAHADQSSSPIRRPGPWLAIACRCCAPANCAMCSRRRWPRRVYGEILARQKLPARTVATVVDGRNTHRRRQRAPGAGRPDRRDRWCAALRTGPARWLVRRALTETACPPTRPSAVSPANGWAVAHGDSRRPPRRGR